MFGSSKISSAIALAAAVALTGCFKETKKASNSNELASFRVTSIGPGLAPQPLNPLPVWNIETAKLFNLKACMVDVAKNGPVANHYFLIMDGGRQVSRKKSDPSGCVTWDEKIEFNALAQPSYLITERTIVADGKQRGQYSVIYGLNPWSGFNGSESPVVSLTPGLSPVDVVRKTEPQEARLLMSAKATNDVKARLVVEAVEPRLIKTNKGETIPMELRISSVKLELVAMNGAKFEKSLVNANFTVQPYIMQWEVVQNRLTNLDVPHEEVKPEELNLRNGVAVHPGIPMAMSYEGLSDQADYDIGIILTPVGGPAGLQPLEATFKIGSRKKLDGTTAQLNESSKNPDAPFSLSALVKDQKIQARMTERKASAPIKVERIKGSYNGQIPVVGQAGQRTVRAYMSVQVLSALTPSPEPGRALEIMSINGNGQSVTCRSKSGAKIPCITDSSGIINWEDGIPNNVFESQMKERRFDVEIKDVASGKSIKRCINVKLSSTSGTIQDCEDLKTFDDLVQQKMVNGKLVFPSLRIGSISWTKNDFETSLLPSLQVETAYRYGLSLNVELVRNDGYSCGLSCGGEPLPTGYYLMTVLLFHNDRARNEIDKLLSATQKVVYHEGSSLNAEVTLPVENTLGIAQDNYMAIQITPVDKNSLKLAADHSVIDQSQFKLSPYDVKWEPHIYRFKGLPASGSASAPQVGNFEDPLVIRLQDSLSQQSAHEVFKRWNSQTSELRALQEKDATTAYDSWLKSAERFKLAPFTLDSKEEDPKIPKFGITTNIDPNIVETLECMDQFSWAPKNFQPKCYSERQAEMFNRFKDICTALQATKAMSEKIDCRTESGISNLLIEARTYAYSFDKKPKYLRGYISNYTVINGFSFGAFDGSDYGNMESHGAEVSAGLDLKEILLKALEAVTAGKANSEATGKVLKWLSIAANGSRSWSAVGLDFTREWQDNQATVLPNTTLTTESADFEIKVHKYRKCFIAKVRVEENGVLLCDAVTEKDWDVKQRYYSLYNSDSSGILINAADTRSRWLLRLRGEREFYRFMTAMSKSLTPYHTNHNPTEIKTIFDRAENKVAMRLRGENGVMTTINTAWDQYVRIPGTLKELSSIYNPATKFGNVPARDGNDPKAQGITDDRPE